MSERYHRLFSLPDNGYAQGAPVVLAAGALLKDNQTGQILAQLKIFAEKEQVKLASVTGLGAVKDFTVGVFDSSAKAYKSNRFQGVYEIVSLVGTINTMNDAFYCHLHMCAGDQEGRAFGGHLNEAVISATCELVVTCLPGETNRVFSDEVGLNLISF